MLAPRPGPLIRRHPPLPAFAAPGAAHLPVGIESSRSISCPTHLHGEWTVRHRPYRLPLPAFAAPAAANLPIGIESSRSTRALGAFGEIALPSEPSYLFSQPTF